MKTMICSVSLTALLLMAGCAGPANQSEGMGGSEANFEGSAPATGHVESDSSGLVITETSSRTRTVLGRSGNLRCLLIAAKKHKRRKGRLIYALFAPFRGNISFRSRQDYLKPRPWLPLARSEFKP